MNGGLGLRFIPSLRAKLILGMKSEIGQREALSMTEAGVRWRTALKSQSLPALIALFNHKRTARQVIKEPILATVQFRS